MKTVVFSLCAGSQSRFESPMPKQLCNIQDETLLLRTARQVATFGHPLHVVTHNKKIINRVRRDKNVILAIADPSTKIVRTILSLTDQWTQRTIFLLGDVYYTDEALTTIFKDRSSIRFFGNYDEIFALVTTKRSQIKLHKDLSYVKKNSDGRLWHLYRYMNGIPFHINRRKSNGLLHYIIDLTDDIDTLNEYRRLTDRLKGKYV